MAIFISAVVAITSLVYFITIFDLLGSVSELMSDLGAPEEAVSNFQARGNSIKTSLALYQFLVTLVIFLGCIIFTHRIAGPMFKLRKFLSDIRDGSSQKKLFFRKGDYFHEVADDINETFDLITEDYRADFVYISEVNTYLNNLAMIVPEDKKVLIEEITLRLQEIQNRFNDEEIE